MVDITNLTYFQVWCGFCTNGGDVLYAMLFLRNPGAQRRIFRYYSIGAYSLIFFMMLYSPVRHASLPVYESILAEE